MQARGIFSHTRIIFPISGYTSSVTYERESRMDRGEKRGVRQGRPVRRATTDIVREADRIIKERLQKNKSGRAHAGMLALGFLLGVIVTLLLILIPRMAFGGFV